MTYAEERDLLGLAPVAPDASERYGGHPSQVVDLYGPRTGPRVTVLHGGFWRERYDRGHLTPFAAALARHGFAVELVEYRRVGGDGGWPASVEDVEAALEYLGGPPAALVGHSAGGHLALCAAARREHAADRVLAVAAVADLARAHDLGLSAGAVAELLGGQPNVRRLLEEADPMRLLPRVPVELLHGTEDAEVPVELSRRYAGNWGARLHLLPGVGHYAPFHPDKPAFGVLLDMIRRG
ncbi:MULTISPECIES: alpha/beta hydrolase [unclassified Streptomyces]|uniref:alpha/beta hydrolase n=1 Tax=unclassified Streptomyces TaxID=2593676 RepID=UPI0022B68C01|nr:MULTISPECIES: alpha/beta hydrolase [unclassified Streptomyces]MCZ7415351.1 alpha/beta hydrolase [Streptomyces sp. WMMC897]MCZ7432274.1 alpha/beta hydrolase [Streptomyces sp. WMMC1477]